LDIVRPDSGGDACQQVMAVYKVRPNLEVSTHRQIRDGGDA
jgi:hypothetical protein